VQSVLFTLLILAICRTRVTTKSVSDLARHESPSCSVARALDRCTGGHGFDSCRGLKWTFHLSYFFPRLTFTIFFSLSHAKIIVARGGEWPTYMLTRYGEGGIRRTHLTWGSVQSGMRNNEIWKEHAKIEQCWTVSFTKKTFCIRIISFFVIAFYVVRLVDSLVGEDGAATDH